MVLRGGVARVAQTWHCWHCGWMVPCRDCPVPCMISNSQPARCQYNCHCRVSSHSISRCYRVCPGDRQSPRGGPALPSDCAVLTMTFPTHLFISLCLARKHWALCFFYIFCCLLSFYILCYLLSFISGVFYYLFFFYIYLIAFFLYIFFF